MAEEQSWWNSFKTTVKDGMAESKYGDWFTMALKGINTALDAKTKSANLTMQAGETYLSAQSNLVNAQRMELNLEAIQRNGQNQINQVMQASKQKEGEMKTAMSANGFEVGSGSYEDLIEQNDYNTRLNVAAIQANMDISKAQNEFEKNVLQIQGELGMKKSRLEQKRAKSARKYGNISGALQTIGGLSGAIGKYNASKK